MPTGAVSHRRADTRRNHDRILTAAAAAITSGTFSFNAIAKQAGVGVGTVYRHFPDRDALVLAVYRREVHDLVDVVPGLLEAHDPEQAFRTWVTDHMARYMMTKRGLVGALYGSGPSGDGANAEAYAVLLEAVSTLVEATVRAGIVRPDIVPATVLRGLGGMIFLDPAGDWRRDAEDLVDLVWRGMSSS